jgi:hypothetical protein
MECGRVARQRLAKVCGELVHHATWYLLAAHNVRVAIQRPNVSVPQPKGTPRKLTHQRPGSTTPKGRTILKLATRWPWSEALAYITAAVSRGDRRSRTASDRRRSPHDRGPPTG